MAVKRTTTVTTATSYVVKFTERELMEILRRAAGAPSNADVEFDIANDGWLRDDAAEVKWQGESVTNVIAGEDAP